MTNEREKQDQTTATANPEPPPDARYLLEQPYPDEAPVSKAARSFVEEPTDPRAAEELHEARISGLPLPPKFRRSR